MAIILAIAIEKQRRKSISRPKENSQKLHDMRDLLSEIEQAVKATRLVRSSGLDVRRWNARADPRYAPAGVCPRSSATGHCAKLLRNLEFYVGPPREGGYVDAARLSRALTGRRMSHTDKARGRVGGLRPHGQRTRTGERDPDPPADRGSRQGTGV